jgi:hypothetical protein
VNVPEEVILENPADETVVAGVPAGGEQKPEFRLSDDQNLVEVGGKKYIREEALHAERQKAQNYAKTIQQLEPLMPEFEQFLAQKQQGRTATVDRATRGVVADNGDYTEDELTGYAITRGYYDQDNKPDLNRAKADLDIMTAIADRRAGKAVKPVLTSTIQDRARVNTERALAQQFVDGEPVADEKYIRAAFDALPDEFKSNTETANMMLVVAAGLQALDDRRNGRTRARGREPMFREGGSGRFGVGGDTLDALDRAAARARGKTPEDWAKTMKAVSTGRDSATGGTILEDI